MSYAATRFEHTTDRIAEAVGMGSIELAKFVAAMQLSHEYPLAAKLRTDSWYHVCVRMPAVARGEAEPHCLYCRRTLT